MSPPTGEFILVYFAVLDGEVTMPLVFAPECDVPRALDILRQAQPIDFWRRYAIARAVRLGLLLDLDLRDYEHAQQDEEFGEAYAVAHGFVDAGDEGPLPEGSGIKRGVWDLMPGVWAEAVSSADAVPRRRRHNRITDAHLAKVAEVYQEAETAGDPPTRAVADHFKTSHSSAARWVGLARSKGLLDAPRTGIRKES